MSLRDLNEIATAALRVMQLLDGTAPKAIRAMPVESRQQVLALAQLMLNIEAQREAQAKHKALELLTEDSP